MEEHEPGSRPGARPETYRRHLDRDPHREERREGGAEPRREVPGRQAEGEQEAGWKSSGRTWRDPDPLEQRLDRWVSAGKQFVGGVAGARPGSRGSGSGRGVGSGVGVGGGGGRGAGRAGLDGLGRWVEGKLDWLLEDGDDWREPWQEPQAQASAPPGGPPAGPPGGPPGGAAADLPPAAGPRRRLEAVSRRGASPGRRSTPGFPGQNGPVGEAGDRSSGPADQDEWPDDNTFSLPRWQRDLRPTSASEPAPGPPPSGGGRPLPRSSRRR